MQRWFEIRMSIASDRRGVALSGTQPLEVVRNVVLRNREHAFALDAGADSAADSPASIGSSPKLSPIRCPRHEQCPDPEPSRFLLAPALRPCCPARQVRSKLAARARADGKAVAPWCLRTPFGLSQCRADEVRCADSGEVVQRDSQLVLPRQVVDALVSACNRLLPAARCEPLEVIGDQAVSP